MSEIAEEDSRDVPMSLWCISSLAQNELSLEHNFCDAEKGRSENTERTNTRRQLTSWRTHKPEIRLFTETKMVRGTHKLEIAVCGEGGESKYRKKVSEGKALTCWEGQSEGQVRTWNESERVRATHMLGSTGLVICQDTERIWVLTNWNRERDKSEQETIRARRSTYFLESLEGGIYQDMERIEWQSSTYSLKTLEREN
jgi:hypothetical protein